MRAGPGREGWADPRRRPSVWQSQELVPSSSLGTRDHRGGGNRFLVVCRVCGRWEKLLLNFPNAGPERRRGLARLLPADDWLGLSDVGFKAQSWGPSRQMGVWTVATHVCPHRAQLTRGM